MIALLPSSPASENSQEPLPPSQQQHEEEEEEKEEVHLGALRKHELHSLVGDRSRAARDFGGLHHSPPAALLLPTSPDDVRRCALLALSTPSLTLTPRGNAHSAHGQSLAGPTGLSLDLSRLSSISFPDDDGEGRPSSVWAGAGALWEDVLRHCLRSARRAPCSWADYLRLSVGGTLSCGGVSGQCFLHGPMACNVAELELVTGLGDLLLCSPSLHSDLFNAALGGLGQFGVITRARIPLYPAPDTVRWVRVVYASFEEYAKDAESLVGRAEGGEPLNYVEGFAFVNGPDPANGWPTVPILPHQIFDHTRLPHGSGPVLYCLEVALHHTHGPSAADWAETSVERILTGLRYVRGLEFAADVSYEEFLTRVNKAEAAARANGTWDAPHPWLNLLVSALDMVDFDRHVFRGILKEGIGGPMLVYPLLKSRWNPNTSLVAPDADVFYLVALLRFGRSFPDGPPVEDLTAQNAEIVDCCVANGYDFKVYLPGYKEQAQWRAHFGREWARFEERKARYDPMGIMGSGQGMFGRKAHGPM